MKPDIISVPNILDGIFFFGFLTSPAMYMVLIM